MNRGNVPQLRFPGFDGEWEEIKLGKLAHKIGDGLHGTPKYSDDSDIHFINGNNLTNGKIEITEKTKKVDYTIFTKNDKSLNENTILISLNGTIGNIAKYNHEKVMLGKSVGYFNFKENTDFYFHVFHTDKIQNFFISELTGSTIKNLSLKTLRETIFPLPTLPEQQKIASFLSAVDEKIQQLSRKKELLEQYKKGVMQQLFSGKLRFKDENGKDYPDWEMKKLGDVGKIVTGKTPSTNDSNLWDGEIQFITPTDIKDDIKYQENTARYVKSSDKIKTLPINSIIYTCIASIGKMCISKYPSITNQQINSLIVNEFNSFEYVYYWLFYLTPYIKTTQANTTLPIINKTDFSKFHISIPSLPEQQKIANFLSSIDTKIENTNSELEKTQGFKKGLLQKMFA
ncbi:type I restriction enzyme, S subunit [Flavobacterium succinicans]|uniref:Type I restriction enzyme, S subunit n=1 Tax=Flavobacterium succinicans TaxID=29536 RepID=A0A1I4TL44_9FLAO|nr:restriction endonuclease subunit S [Flavobacterium succinicans]SFM77270.1 type I restriction enzyme, S subunit [Flavobacterium succinicans]